MKMDNDNDIRKISKAEDVVKILHERGKIISIEDAEEILAFLHKAEELTHINPLRPGPESLN